MGEREYKLQTTLYPFQREAVERAKAFGGRCLFAMPMGSGKSISAITYIMETKSFPAVIVCPASLKYNWAQEFHKHYDKVAIILEGTDPKKFGSLTRSGDKVFIVNYDILKTDWTNILKLLQPEIIVLDEAHLVKTPSTIRTKACAQLAYQAPKFIALTGTPITQTPMDMYNILNMMFKGHICSRWQFQNRYTKYHKTRFGLKYDGPKNTVELHTFLTNRCMVRYKQEEILPDLPPYTRQTVFLELTAEQRKEYEKLQEDFCRWMVEKFPDRRIPTGDAQLMAQFGYAKRRVAEFKIPAILEHINLFLDSTDEKLIVFGLHKRILQAIWDVYSKLNTANSPFIVGLDGSTSSVQRHEAVFNFNENPHTRIFLGQMQAAGVGLNLQKACRTSLFAEIDFSPHIHEQSEARNRRIGTVADHVHYTYLIYRDTIEERVMEMLFKKSQTSVRVIDGQEGMDADNASFNLVRDLVADMLRRKFK